MLAAAGTPIPELFGPYELLERLAQAGSSAEVFRGRAVDERGQIQHLLIARLSAEQSQQPEHIAQMTEQARMLEQLRHEGVPRLFDFGILGGCYYLATTTAEGSALADVLAHLERTQATMPVRVAVFVATRICHVLCHALDRAPQAAFSIDPAQITISLGGQVVLTGIHKRSAKDQEVRVLASVLRRMLCGVADDPSLPPSRINPDVPARLDVVVAKARSPGYGAPQALIDLAHYTAQHPIQQKEVGTWLRELMALGAGHTTDEDEVTAVAVFAARGDRVASSPMVEEALVVPVAWDDLAEPQTRVADEAEHHFDLPPPALPMLRQSGESRVAGLPRHSESRSLAAESTKSTGEAPRRTSGERRQLTGEQARTSSSENARVRRSPTGAVSVGGSREERTIPPPVLPAIPYKASAPQARDPVRVWIIVGVGVLLLLVAVAVAALKLL